MGPPQGEDFPLSDRRRPPERHRAVSIVTYASIPVLSTPSLFPSSTLPLFPTGLWCGVLVDGGSWGGCEEIDEFVGEGVGGGRARVGAGPGEVDGDPEGPGGRAGATPSRAVRQPRRRCWWRGERLRRRRWRTVA